MKRKNAFWVLALSAALIVSLAACSGKKAEEPKAAPGLKIGIITTSGVDDGSFNENCYNGILAFLKTHPTATVKDIKEPDMNKCISAVADVIADYDVLVLPGFNYAGCGTIAQENPSKKIILVDTAPVDAKGNPVELANVYSMTFAEQESGFFAGIAAALESKTGKVAVINGIAYPSNVNYQYGFECGVAYAKAKYGTKTACVEIASYAGKDVTGANVGGNYIGSFADEASGKVVGNALIAKGCDILFVAAGSSGNGVFAAAKEAKDVYVIGCDVDQYDDGANGPSNIILTSALKVMDINVEKQLNAIADGTFAGKNELLFATSGSTGIVTAAGRHQMSDATVAKLKEAFELVKNGTIVPAANFNGHTPEKFPGLN